MLGVVSRATGSTKSVLVVVETRVQQPGDFCRSVCCQQVTPARVMQGARLLLCRGISARLGTDGKRGPGTIALGLGLAHPTSLTRKRDRPFIRLRDSSCCVTLL